MYKTKKTVKILVLIMFLVFNFSFVALGSNKNKINQYLESKNQLEYIKSQIKENKKQIEALNQETEELNEQIQIIDDIILNTENEIEMLNKEISYKEYLVETYDNKKNEEIEKIKNNKNIILNGYFKVNKEEELFSKILIQELKNKKEINNNLGLELKTKELLIYYELIKNEIENKKINTIDINSNIGLLNIEKEKLEENKILITQKLNFIKEQQEKKQQLLNEKIAQKNNYENSLDELESSSKQLISIIQRLQSYGYTGIYIPKGNGSMLWPVNGGVISSPYGNRVHPVYKTVKFHTGIDIAAPLGTSIYAANEGMVIYSGWIKGYGYTVIIDHGNQISTLYAHNSKLLVKEGDIVKKGQEISKMGSTGISTGSHLHFEVRIKGQPTNPMDWL